MPINNRVSVQFPPGLEKEIRARAAKAGLPVRTYFSILAARGFHAEERQEIQDTLFNLNVALERLWLAQQEQTKPDTVTAPSGALAPAILKTLAEIFARTELTAGKANINLADRDALVSDRFKLLSQGKA